MTNGKTEEDFTRAEDSLRRAETRLEVAEKKEASCFSVDACRYHAVFEHLKPDLGVSLVVNIQLPYYLTSKLNASQSACGDYLLVGNRKLVNVPVPVFVVRHHRL